MGSLRKEFFEPGHLACAGCGAALAMRIASQVFTPEVRLVVPASCWSIILGRHPMHSVALPAVHTPFALAADFATGMSRAVKISGKKAKVLVWAGDGATYDIGFSDLSAAAERNEDMIYVCYDNEAYMNTGVQRSSATPIGAWSTTTPAGKRRFKKNIAFIVAEHGVPYVATSSISHPEDLKAKFKKALELSGFRFILLLCPCPTGWLMESSKTVLAARLAVESGLFPLLEIESGKIKVNYRPSFSGLKEYFSLQGRFSHLESQDIQAIKAYVKKLWERIDAYLRVQMP